METDNQVRVEQFWMKGLALPPESFADLPPITCTVQQRYSGVQLLKRADRLIVGAPPHKAEFIKKATAGCSPDDVFSVDWLQHVFADAAGLILGPALVNYADRSSFQSRADLNAREISVNDADEYRDLVTALDSTELHASGLSADVFPAFGVFHDGKLCAVANYSVWDECIAHIVVATHPAWRRRGFAKAVVHALATHAFDRGLILQWRALHSNPNSLNLASQLGFRYYCSTIYVRLRTVHQSR